MTQLMTPESPHAQSESQWLQRIDMNWRFGASLESREEKLIGKLRMQWQFGDWESLAQIEISAYANYTKKAEIALLAACAQIQLGNLSHGKALLLMAKEWGCDKKLMITLLVAGVYEQIAEYSQMRDWNSKAIECWGKSAEGLGGDQRLLATAKQRFLSEDNSDL